MSTEILEIRNRLDNAREMLGKGIEETSRENMISAIAGAMEELRQIHFALDKLDFSMSENLHGI